MKTKHTILFAALTLLIASCASPMRCPACKCKGRYNAVQNQTVGEKEREFHYTRNNKDAVKLYKVPTVTETSDAWECSNGHRISVAR